MDVGMLWFDNDPQRKLDRKITRAADYYRKKYRRIPSLCFVNPAAIQPKTMPPLNGKIMAGKIEIRTAPWMLPNHYWIGVGDEEGECGRPK